MVMKFLSKLFGSKNDRELKRMSKIVDQINSLEESVEQLTEEEIRLRKDIFRQRLMDGESLDQLLPEAFAITREVGKRTLGQRIFDVQMIGGNAHG